MKMCLFHEPYCGEMSYVEESFKKFVDLDAAVDDFQNLVSSSLSTDTSLVKFWLISDQ